MDGQRPNVVVVVIDALRPDYVTESTAPWFTDFASDGVRFENAFSPITTTEPLLASFYTGKYPRTTGVFNHGTKLTRSDLAMLEKQTFVQERFRSRGYTTLAFDWLGRWHESGYDYYSGALAEDGGRTTVDAEQHGRSSIVQTSKRKLIDVTPPSVFRHVRRLKHQIAPPTVEPAGWLPDSADAVVDAAIREVSSRSSPFYLFVHFWDTHAPYDVPEEAVEAFGDPNDAIARYRGGISFVDEQLSRLHEAIDREDERDTLYLVMGDHGESLGEHGIYFAHHGLYDVTLRVPMVIHHPSLPSGATVQEFVQHVDLAPTLMELCFDESIPDVDGQSLVPTVLDGRPTRESVFAEEAHTQRKAAVRTTRHKYIETLGDTAVCEGCHVIHGGERELYDLESDPDERHNRIDVDVELASELHDRLLQWRQSATNERERIHAAVERLTASNEFQRAI